MLCLFSTDSLCCGGVVLFGQFDGRGNLQINMTTFPARSVNVVGNVTLNTTSVTGDMVRIISFFFLFVVFRFCLSVAYNFVILCFVCNFVN